MEQKLRDYETYIEKKTSAPLGPLERLKLAEYHREMVTNFQHERLIHLLVTLFFALVLFALFGALIFSVGVLGIIPELIPLYALFVIFLALTLAYIKHYYYLENHVQSLYKYTRKLRE